MKENDLLEHDRLEFYKEESQSRYIIMMIGNRASYSKNKTYC